MQTLRRPLIVSAVVTVLLAGCSTWTQPPAPVEQANPYAGNTAGNAYGAPPQEGNPYTPANTPPAYAPQQAAANPYATPNHTYVPSTAPVDLNAPTHTVVYGDTVYNIAKRYQISENDLRAWNNLADNNIRTGQVLTVRGTPTPGNPPPSPLVPPPSLPTNTVSPPSPPPVSPHQSASETRDSAGIVWMRPTQGAELTRYGGASKGIDYGGKSGQPIYAAADGKVVYSGSSDLPGYGNLVIVQHNGTYLTAYGNNETLLVKEGQQVRRGQEIARMGKSDTGRVQLHFELREKGKPINPSSFLP